MDFNTAYQLIVGKLTVWLHGFIRLLPNIFIAALVLVTGFYLAGKIKKVALKLIKKISHNATLDNLFASIIHIFFIGVTIFVVLSILQLDKAVTSILAGAGIIGLALAFAFQDIAANFISGIFISFRRPLYVGDIVKVKDYMGKVEEVNLRDTILRTFQGQMVIIPNKEVFQNPIENFSLLGKRRIDLTIGISYGEDLEKVKKVTLEAVRGIEGLSEQDETTLFYTEFGDSSINFLLRIWIKSPEQPVYLHVGSQAIMHIKKAYDTNDILIPFPIRTMDFGIKGGTPLNEMLQKSM
ncbi:MAG: mechanosensitive ion channel family protein [Bacteroidota bacterium]|nr:mechanosensitive ion channel family protein [Bacteroidota bacterium]